MPAILADHYVARESVLILRSLGYDVASVRDVFLDRAHDDELLPIAAEQDSTFLTHNI